MITLLKYFVGCVLAVVLLISCDKSKSLQYYIVDKQDDDRFLKVDIATSLLKDIDSLPADQKQVLNTVKKMNVVAYPISEGSMADYTAEKAKLDVIFDQEAYKLLGKFRANGQNIRLMYLGEDDAIDEVIVYGNDDKKGLALFRLLGDDINPADVSKLAAIIQQGNLDLSQLTGISDIFNENDSNSMEENKN